MPAPSPRSVPITRNRRSTSRSVSEAVGSSRIRILACAPIALAISTSCCSGMLSVLTVRSGAISAPVRSSSSRACRRRARQSMRRHSAGALQRQRDILLHRQIRKQGGLLIHRRDPQRARRGRAVVQHQVAIHHERAGIGLLRAGDHFDQRGLPRPVLPQQRMHLARAQFERHAAQRLYSGERFGDCGGVEQCHSNQYAWQPVAPQGLRPALPESSPRGSSMHNTPLRDAPWPAASDRPERRTVCRARSSARRDSGIGDTPNSMPRVSVLPFHGACVRLWFSSQIPSHGKSACFHTYPNTRRAAGANAAKKACSRAGSIRCVVKAHDAAAPVSTRKSSMPPSRRGAMGQSNSAAPRSVSSTPNSLSNTLDRVAEARNCVTPFSRNGGPSVTCCVQPIGRSNAVRFSTLSRIRTARSRNSMRRSNAICASGKRARRVRAPPRFLDLVARHRPLAVHRDAGREFLVRRSAENIQAQVVPHDAREQLALHARAVFGVHAGTVRRGLDGAPRRRPQRIDAGFLIEDFGDVPAFLQHGHTQVLVLDCRRAAAAIDGH